MRRRLIVVPTCGAFVLLFVAVAFGSDEQIQSQFPIFARHRESADILTKRARRALLEEGKSGLVDPDPSTSRRAVKASVGTLWLVQGRTGLCAVATFKGLGSPSSQANCLPFSSARSGYLVIEHFERTGTGVVVIGAVPSRVKSVEVIPKEGKVVIAPVRWDGYWAQVRAPVAIRFRQGDVQHHVGLVP